MGVALATRFDIATGQFVLTELPIALTGSWVKDGHRFSITEEDLSDIVKNFEKRGNGEVVVDYEHASERPEVARGGPVPAAAWIQKLSIRDSDGGDGKTLWGDINFTDEAKKYIEDKKYKYFSPAIDWGATDKHSGRGKGATLTSGALTNHPFLEELPAIQLSEKGKILDKMVVPVVDGAKIKIKIDAKHEKEKKLAELEAAELAETTKSEGDGSHPSSHYLVVEDPKKSSTWHLRVKNKSGENDHGLMGAAWAALHSGYRGNKYEGPKKSEAISKLKGLYKSEGMNTPDQQKSSEVAAMKMTDKDFRAAVLQLTEAIPEEKQTDLSKKLREVLDEGDETPRAMKAICRSTIKLLDDIDEYGVEGDRGEQDSLRSEAESRAKKIDTEDEDAQILADKKAKKEDDDDDDALQARDGATKVPKFSIRKVKAEDKIGRMGHHAIMHDGKLAGTISHGQFMAHAKMCGAEVGRSAGTMKASDEQLEEIIQEQTGRPLTLAETVKLVEVGINAGSDQSRSKARKLLMTEALDDNGTFDHRKVRRLFADGKIDRVDYADFEDAVEDVEKFITEGRFLPKQRGKLIGLCLSDRENFLAFGNSQPRSERTNTLGLRSNEEEGMTASQEVMRLTEEKMKKDDKLTYGRALTQVLTENQPLKDRYNKEQRKLM
ncbi:MAG: phage protease [Candidatus Acidiferrum sp.]